VGAVSAISTIRCIVLAGTCSEEKSRSACLLFAIVSNASINEYFRRTEDGVSRLMLKLTLILLLW
jgi:hypothetical protein